MTAHGTWWANDETLLNTLENTILGFKFDFLRSANGVRANDDWTGVWAPQRNETVRPNSQTIQCFSPFPNTYAYGGSYVSGGTTIPAGDGTGWTKAASGFFDNDWRTHFNKLNALFPPNEVVYITFGLEANGYWFAHRPGKEHDKFRQAYKRFAMIGHSISSRFKIGLFLVCHNDTSNANNCTTAQQLFVPPDSDGQHVDFIGISYYMKPQFQTGQTADAQRMFDYWMRGGTAGTGWNVVKALCDQYNIEKIIPELGLSSFKNTEPGQSRTEFWPEAEYRKFVMTLLLPKVLSDTTLCCAWSNDDDYPADPRPSSRPIMQRAYKDFYTAINNSTTPPTNPTDPTTPEPTKLPEYEALLTVNTQAYQETTAAATLFTTAQKAMVDVWEGYAYWPLAQANYGGKVGPAEAGTETDPFKAAKLIVTDINSKLFQFTGAALTKVTSWRDLLAPYAAQVPAPPKPTGCDDAIAQAVAPLNAQINTLNSEKSALQAQVNALTAERNSAVTARDQAIADRNTAYAARDAAVGKIAAYKTAHNALIA